MGPTPSHGDERWHSRVPVRGDKRDSPQGCVRIFFNAGTRQLSQGGREKPGSRERKAGSAVAGKARNNEGQTFRRTNENAALMGGVSILERETRLELATPTLARSCSTN